MKNNQYDFDLICLGGGSGGIAAANRAASYGAKCALIEAADIGGTCVNRGCVPKKMMWYAAEIMQKIKDAQLYQFLIDKTQFNWKKFINLRDQYLEKLQNAYLSRLEKNKVQFISGHGDFVDKHTIIVNQKKITARHIIIATGCQAVMPNIPGVEYAIHSDGFFLIQEQPSRAVIVGGGYIGIEIAGVLAGLGTEVILVIKRTKPLALFDEMIRDNMLLALKHQNIKIHAECEVSKITADKKILLSNGMQLENIDLVLFAIGRKNNLKNITAEKIGIHHDEKDFIVVDEWQNTSVDSVYAIGDVTGKFMLTPVAIAAGRRLADRLFGGQLTARFHYELIPTVLFSHPPAATVGLTEKQAREKYGEIKIYQTTFTPLYYAFHDNFIKTTIKIITYQDKIIGCHMLGLDAAEILQGFAVALQMGATIQDFKNTLAIHPTSAEEWVTIF